MPAHFSVFCSRRFTMPSSMNNKRNMYSFEKVALLITLAIAVAIVLLVVFGTSGGGKTSTRRDNSVVASEQSSDVPEGGSSADSVIPERNIDFTNVTVDNTKLSEGDLILVNYGHEYTVDISDSLVNVYSANSASTDTTDNWYGLVDVSQRLHGKVLDALNLMYKDYYAALERADVTITKTYVDVATQQSEYENLVASADPTEKPYLQAGGCSEHQTGLAFNLKSGDTTWFEDNCWKYGFINRYPEGKEDTTHVKGEANHYRYVGKPHAAYMKIYKLVLEDYLGLLETKTYTSRLKLDDGTDDKYETYAVKAEAGATTEIPVPDENSGWGYMISGTNNKFFVVTIYKLSE